jgi:hypothetical protein
MKNTLLIIILLASTINFTAQTFPLRTFSELPNGAYLKDTNNELQDYEGNWKGSWDGKIISVKLKKMNYFFNSTLKIYSDILIAKFKVTDSNNNILFDNSNINDDLAKITGGKFFKKYPQKYSLIYVDSDICGIHGLIEIEFTNANKNQLNWKFNEHSNIITPDCPYYNSATFPEPLPKSIILTKQ